jgi:hypothetical protein
MIAVRLDAMEYVSFLLEERMQEPGAECRPDSHNEYKTEAITNLKLNLGLSQMQYHVSA